MTNCKNCGAPLESEKCPYCGTIYRKNYQSVKAERQEVFVCTDFFTEYMMFKGTKTNTSLLPTTGNKTGDVWIITADNSEYVWTGSEWKKFGTTDAEVRRKRIEHEYFN